MRFVPGTEIMKFSPKGRMIMRTKVEHMAMPLGEILKEVDRLFYDAAGRKRYRLLTLEQDRRMRESIKKRRSALRLHQKSRE